MRFKYAIPLMCLVASSVAVASTSFYVQPSAMSINYKEYIDSGKLLDSEQTNPFLYGLDGGINTTVYSNNSFSNVVRINGKYYSGNTQYKGSPLNKNDGTYGSLTGNTKDTIYNIAISNRFLFKFKNLNFLTDIGLGRRNWNRQLSANQDEKYTWYYDYISSGVEFAFNSKLSLGIKAKYCNAINPTMRSYINGDSTIPSYMKFNLGRTYGYSLTVPFKYKITNSFDIIANYTYGEWNIGKSNTVSSVYHEPRSKTKYNIVSIGLSTTF